MNEFVRSRDNTPAPLLNMDREHEEQMINNFRSEMESKMKEKAREQKAEEKQVEEEAKKEQEEISVTERIVAFETVATEPTPGARQNIVDSGDIKVEVHATAVHHDQVVEPKMAHAMSHEISHSQAVSQSNAI